MEIEIAISQILIVAVFCFITDLATQKLATVKSFT